MHSILQLFELEKISGNINILIIQNCKDLFVNAGTFQDVAFISKIQFRNIKSLSMNQYSLEFGRRLPTPKIKVTFQNVSDSCECIMQFNLITFRITFDFIRIFR